MPNLQLISDYKNNPEFRLSFNDLAHQVFGIDFEQWYQKGYWNERYIPYSFIDGSRVVANVSANLMDLIINGEKRKAIQIGTVMTRPDYRGQGLAAELMKTVLNTYEKEYSLFYLFANKNSMNFYPRFDFKLVYEKRFMLHADFEASSFNGCRPLDVRKTDDLNLIHRLAIHRLPISQRFGAENTSSLVLWYALNIFPSDIFYIAEDDAIVIAQQDDETLIIYDIISTQLVDFLKLLPKIIRGRIRQVIFQFTPDRLNVPAIATTLEPQELYVRTSSPFIEEDFKYPTTAQA